LYSGPIKIVYVDNPLQAIAVASGYSASNVASATYLLDLPYAAAPNFSVGPGTYNSPQTVTISDSTPGATIYYQINGNPTTSSPVYSGPITVSSSETVWAMAAANNYFPSYASVIYTINSLAPQTATPTFSVPTGTYTTPQTVMISDTTSGASIYYSTDGSTPTTNSAVYAGPIIISSSGTLQAIAMAGGDSVSAIASATYTINLPQPAAPVFSVPAGTYASAQTVTISDTTTGTTIYYTTNGMTPTTSSAVYSGQITVSSTETLEAVAAGGGYPTSDVTSATYTINLPAPDFSVAATPASITVTAGQSVATSISVAPLNGFNSAVSFSCSGLPTGASCSFSPSTVTPVGTAISTMLTVSTSAATATVDRGRSLLFPGSALAVMFCLFGRKKRRRLILSLLLLTAVIGGVLLNGCGGSAGSGSGPTSATSTVTVIAASGSLQHTTTFSLTTN
jgi:hypothetical protein